MSGGKTLFNVMIGAAGLSCFIAINLLFILHHSDREKLRSRHQKVEEKSSIAHNQHRTIVITRIHNSHASNMPSTDKLIHFIESCDSYADHVLVCTNQNISEYQNLIDSSERYKSKVTLLVVTPWGYFTTALNAGILFSQDHGYDTIIFQSFEYKTSFQNAKMVINHLYNSDADVAVAGLALDGHDFQPDEGEVPLRGRTTPWNTFAAWNMKYLGLVGFPIIGDGVLHDRKSGGVEEVSAISIIQTLHPKVQARLIQIRQRNTNSTAADGSSWNTRFDDEERKLYHERKMQSKDERPAKQLALLGTANKGNVMHIVEYV